MRAGGSATEKRYNRGPVDSRRAGRDLTKRLPRGLALYSRRS
jgi:hypothetical protein